MPLDDDAAPAAPAYEYEGPPELREPIDRALHGVVDPEMALDIVDVGLVYRVRVEPQRVHVLMTMTSAACPAAGLILEEVEVALQRLLPEREPEVELTWEPAWTPVRLSPRARRFMGW